MNLRYSYYNLYLWTTGRLSAVESQFARHRTIRPAVYHGREKRQLQHTHQQVKFINCMHFHFRLLSIPSTLSISSGWARQRCIHSLLPGQWFIHTGPSITQVNDSSLNASLIYVNGQFNCFFFLNFTENCCPKVTLKSTIEMEKKSSGVQTEQPEAASCVITKARLDTYHWAG